MHLKLIQNSPALLLEEGTRRVLIVGDLHIGYERTLFKQEYYSSNIGTRIIKEFEQLVADIEPSEVIILGDLKHSIRNFSTQEFQQIAQLLAHLQQQAAVTIIRGNHDADLDLVIPDNTQLISAAGFSLKFKSRQIYLLHGHAIPSAEILSCDSLIMGHIHPAISISQMKNKFTTHRVWVKTNWKPTIIDAVKNWIGEDTFQNPEVEQQFLQMNILVIPAYLNLLRGHILNEDSPTAHLGTPLFRHLSLDDAEIVMLDHTPLGTLKELKKEKDKHKETF
ncbi:MAG: metallophosphoesterase [Promethearchaeota archaeon]